MRKILLSLTAASAHRGGRLGRSGQRHDGRHGIRHPGGDRRREPCCEDVAYVCRHRYYSSRRVCWWRPGGYGWRRGWRRHW